MKQRLLIILFFLGSLFSTIEAQIFTGGRGDGAAMSCVPPQVTTVSSLDIRCVSDTMLVLAIRATGSNLKYVWQKKESNFYVSLEDAPHFIGLGTDSLRIIIDRDFVDLYDGHYRVL